MTEHEIKRARACMLLEQAERMIAQAMAELGGHFADVTLAAYKATTKAKNYTRGDRR